MIVFVILSVIFAVLAGIEMYRTCVYFYKGIRDEHYGMKSRGFCLLINTAIISFLSVLCIMIA